MEDLVVASSPFQNLLMQAERVARSSANVMITGESGTGKEVIAQYIHKKSTRNGQEFVALNCSAIPESLLEAELFGYAKGSFTGAQAARRGLFEEADNGTLFLDEIGDMDLTLQAKLLRVLQERKLKRIGENHYRDLNIRIIAATHQNMQTAIQEKRFREDLFFRLNVVTLRIPPLRERREDIFPLAKFFLNKFTNRHRLPKKIFSADMKTYLENQIWKGNVRELENSVERAVVLSSHSEITPEDMDLSEVDQSTMNYLFEELTQEKGRILTLEELDYEYTQFVLNRNAGLREKTAKDLGIDRKTLYRRLT